MCYKVQNFATRAQLSKLKKLSVQLDSQQDQAVAVLDAFDHPNLKVIRSTEAGLVLGNSRWGLIPEWASVEQAPQIWNSTLNARYAELEEKPSFKTAVQYGRIIIVATGFYEFQTFGKDKIPFCIQSQSDSGLFLFAGLESVWWNSEKQKHFSTCSIITTEANSIMAEIHNVKLRMPMYVSEESALQWLNHEQIEKPHIQAASESELETFPITSLAHIQQCRNQFEIKAYIRNNPQFLF